jgi:hypothetical protein
VYGSDLCAADGSCVLKGEADDTLAGWAGDKFDGLHDTVYYNVLDA